MRPLCRILFASILAVSLASPALAQIESAPCAGQPLKCVDLNSPNFQLAATSVVRVRTTDRYDSGATSNSCGTAWNTDSTVTINGNQYRVLATVRHNLEGTDNTGHYMATAVSVDFFYFPLREKCGVALGSECGTNPPADSCNTPTTVVAPCWDWDNTCDIGRIFIPIASEPGGAGRITLGANPAAGDSLWVPGHPKGRCMEWDSGPVVTANRNACQFTYTISTETGNSGSPVISIATGLAVGVHSASSPGLVCPNVGEKVSQLARFMAVQPGVATNLQCPGVTATVDKTWGQLKIIYR